MKGRLIGILGAALLLAPGVVLASEAGAEGAKMTDFLYRVLNFAVMAGVLIYLVRKPITSGLSNRAKAIKEELEELETKREQAEKDFAVMEKRLSEAEAERKAILDEYKEQGIKEKARIIDDAQVLAERIRSQAQFTIDQETKQAKAELRREIADLSSALAEDLVKEQITAEDQKNLVDDYLTKVGQEVQ